MILGINQRHMSTSSAKSLHGAEELVCLFDRVNSVASPLEIETSCTASIFYQWKYSTIDVVGQASQEI